MKAGSSGGDKLPSMCSLLCSKSITNVEIDFVDASEALNLLKKKVTV